MNCIDKEQAIKLGTLSHNRSFTPREAHEYGLNLQMCLRRKLVERVERGKYYPTPKGWRFVEVWTAQLEASE